MYNDLDDTCLTCIEDLLQKNAYVGPESTSKYDSALYCVVGIVINSVFREVPSRKVRNQTYSVLDLEIIDETCKVSQISKQTLGVRLWGAITRDHLRHRFVEGSIILLDSLVLQHDTYRDGRLTLQQRSFHDRSVSYVLCEDQSDDGNVTYWFDGGNKLYPRIWLYPERYPKLYSRVISLRQWAQQSHNISNGNVSLSSLSKERTPRAQYVENFGEAAGMFGQRAIDICVPVTVFALTPSNDTIDRSKPSHEAVSIWQFAGECNDGTSRAAIALSDKVGNLARLLVTSQITERALENCVKSALNILQASRAKAPRCLKLTPSSQHPITLASSGTGLLGKRKFETLTAQSALDPIKATLLAQKCENKESDDDTGSEDEEPLSENDTLKIPPNQQPTYEYEGRAMSVATVHLMMLLHSVRVQESAQGIATFLVADTQATFQALVMGPHSNPQLLAPSTSVLSMTQKAPPVSSWQQFASIVHDTSLLTPCIVSVRCCLKQAHFPAFVPPLPPHNVDGKPVANLVQVVRSRCQVVRAAALFSGRDKYKRPEGEQRSWAAAADLLRRTRDGTKTSADVKPTVSSRRDPISTARVNYRDAVFVLGPMSFAPDKECANNLSTGIGENTDIRSCQQSMPPPNRKSSETARYSQKSLDFYNTGGSTAPTPPSMLGTYSSHRNYAFEIQPSTGIHALVRDEVLTRRIFNNIPASLAAISHSRTHYTQRMESLSAEEKANYPADTALVAAIDSLPSYNYAAAVCRLASALVHSCKVQDNHGHNKTGLLVDVELLVSPVRDEHGMHISLQQNRCVIRDMRFLET